MDENQASLVAESWRGGGGLVARGPKWLLGWDEVSRDEAELRTRRRVGSRAEVWRVQVGGRFLQAQGTVYPGGVPFPDELTGTVAAVCSEVWLYVDTESAEFIGSYSWPEALRRPIASRPVDDFPERHVMGVERASEIDGVRIELPAHPGWDVPLLVSRSRRDVVALCVAGALPDPLNEMLLFGCGGLTLRLQPGDPWDIHGIAGRHGPPYRRTEVSGCDAAGREPGRTLGPHTWPWPGELMWWRDGQRYTLKGFVPLAKLVEVAATVR